MQIGWAGRKRKKILTHCSEINSKYGLNEERQLTLHTATTTTTTTTTTSHNSY